MITVTAGRNETPRAEKCQAIENMASGAGGFGNEISFEIREDGTWIIRIFDCYGSQNEIVLSVTKNGHIRIIRKDGYGGVYQERVISF